VLADAAGNYHLLIHSGTLHGIQSRDASRLRQPLSYYSRRGPLGQAFQALGSRLHGRAVAVVGLGAGAAACYADPSERWTFYEIDRQVIRIAENPHYFSFLSLCTPTAPVIAGDARLELAAQRPVSNAVMILDAYSADAVPTHLLTVEALDLYLRNLAEDGVLLFNISNQYFDLRPVLGNLAAARGLVAYYEEDAIGESTALRTGQFGSRWVAMARKSSDLASISSDPRWTRIGSYAGVPLWTDDYSSLIRVLYGVVH
jgi:spermidine synthase